MRPLHTWSLEQLRARRSLKWARFGPDVLPLWVAEMDAPLAPAIHRVLQQVAETQDLGYPVGDEYATAFGEFAHDTWGWSPQGSAAMVDVMTGVVNALSLIAGPQVSVIVNPPVYPPFFEAVRAVGAQSVEVPLASTWRLDLDALAEAFSAHAGRAAYLLCNPQNPTSLAPTRDELTVIAELAQRYSIRVVVDEIHAPLTPPEEFTPYLSLPGTEDAFVATSAAKAWNIAGVKAGLLVAGEQAQTDLARLPALSQYGGSTLGVSTQIAAWREGREWLDAVRRDLAENREIVRDLVARHIPMAGLVTGSASYLAWLDLRAYGLGDDPAASLLESAQVALSPGPPFGRGEGFARLNYATTPQILTMAFERLGATLHPRRPVGV